MEEVLGTSALVIQVLGLAAATAAAAWAFDGAHSGRIAGNEAMAVSALWGGFGLLMSLTDRALPSRNLRNGARAALAAALLYLVLGAMQGNGRWAEPLWRSLGYAGVLGSVWAAEYLMRERDVEEDLGGLLSLTAAAVGFGAVAFEVDRFLVPVFTVPVGQWVTPERLAWQDSTRTFLTVALWGPYAALLMAAGAWQRSPKARLLAFGMAAIGLIHATILGLANPSADGRLRAAALVSLVSGALIASYVSLHARGEKFRWEPLCTAAMRYGSLVFATAAFVIFRQGG